MPRIKRTRRSRSRPDWTPEHREFLETGSCDEWNFLCEPPAFNRETPEGLAEIAAAWQEHGAEITAEWIANQPGTRPWAWWFVDHGMRPPHDEQEALERAGVITAEERTALAAQEAT